MLTTPLTSALSEYTVTDAHCRGEQGLPFPISSDWNLTLDGMVSNTVAAPLTRGARQFPVFVRATFFSSPLQQQHKFPATRCSGFASRAAIKPLRRNSPAEGEMTKRWVLSLVACVVLVLASTAAYGQAVFGNIVGTANDPQGAAVAGVKVTVTSTTKDTSVTTTTNESGNYSVTHLIPDIYKIRFESAGFKTFEQGNVPVSADGTQRVDVQFTVGATSETMEVTGEPPQLQTDKSDIAVEFNSTYVSEMPTLNRNFTTFELMSPGTQKLTGWSHANTENPQGSQQIFVNGQHFSGTNYQLDGTDNQDPILGIIVINPNLRSEERR